MIGLDRTSELRAAVSDSWHWWVDELADLVPSSLRGVPDAQIVLGHRTVRVERRVGDVLEVHAEGKALEELDDDAWAELAELLEGYAVQIVLENPLCWTGSVTLPKGARSRLKTAVELQLPSIAPLQQQHLVWGAMVREVLGDELDVAVPMTKKSFVEYLDSAFSNQGLRVPSIFVRAPDGDRLIRRGHRRISTARSLRENALLIAGALVAAIPVITLAVAALLTSLNNGKIAALQAALEPRIAAEAEWQKDEMVRRALGEISKTPPVSDILARLDDRMPEAVRLTSLGLENGTRLSVTAQADSASSIQKAFSSDPTLSGLRPIAEVPQDGRMSLITFEGGSR